MDVAQPTAEQIAELLALADDLLDCESLSFVGRVDKCEIGNFSIVASVDKAPVAYFADQKNAQYAIAAMTLAPALARRVTELEHLVAELTAPVEDAAIQALRKAFGDTPHGSKCDYFKVRPKPCVCHFCRIGKPSNCAYRECRESAPCNCWKSTFGPLLESLIASVTAAQNRARPLAAQ